VLLHPASKWKTLYAHASRTAVEEGQWVKEGELLGYVGSTGRSTGPHLHFEVIINGRPRDPLQLVSYED
jgi:murein DD-endopeptidase MepM/ murein hydrolase activator NlpD